MNLTDNPYFEKYAAKIAKLQKTSPEEFLSKIQQSKDEEQKKQEQEKRDYSELMNPKKKIETKSELPYKKLEDVMKVDLMEGKTAEEIKAIWIEYHVLKDSIAAVIPSEVFDLMMERAKKYPIFILPIPRSQGFAPTESEDPALSLQTRSRRPRNQPSRSRSLGGREEGMLGVCLKS